MNSTKQAYTFSLGVSISWSSNFRKINWLPVEGTVELCTLSTVFNYWKRIASSFLSNMFMPFQNSFITRLRMVFDTHLWRTNKGYKVCHFLVQKSEKKGSPNIKIASTATYLWRNSGKKTMFL